MDDISNKIDEEMLNGKNSKFYAIRECKRCGKRFVYRIKQDTHFCSNACSANWKVEHTDTYKKMKATKLKRYGFESYVNPEKAKKTCLEKYGVDNASKSEEVIDKIKESNLKKYGVEWSAQADEVKEKMKATLLENYGVDTPFSSPEIKNKAKNTMIETHGVSNPFQLDSVKEKSKQTNLKKYGTEYAIQSAEIKEQRFRKSVPVMLPNIIDRITTLSNCVPLFTAEEYNGTYKENLYKFKCNMCKTEFTNGIDGGRLPRCPTCYPYKYSKAHIEIVNFIHEILPTEEVVENVRSILPSGLEIDIYLPNKKVGIEYDSFYYHGEAFNNKPKDYHVKKTNEAESIGIHLIHIFEDEWKDSQEIVKSKIRAILKVASQKKPLFARKTAIKQITDISSVRTFLDKHHIQGFCPASVHYGAYNGNELVAIMSFSTGRVALGGKNINDFTYELVRFAASEQINGIGKKILTAFFKQHRVKTIVSFADRRYTNIHKNVYLALGFSCTGISAPNYWYFLNGTAGRFHRYGFRKSELSRRLQTFDAKLSEWENMKINGYDRIWDCGNLKFSLNIAN